MNKKRTTAPIVAIIVIALGAMLIARLLPGTGVPNGEDGLVLKDSVKISDYTLYWFERGSAFASPSMSYMAVAKSPCLLSDSTAVVKGEFIVSIDHVAADTVYICSQFGFDTNNRFNSARLIFVNLGNKPGASRTRLSVKKDVLVSSICK